ncbi:MAG TPA: AAA family ATPase, partial [Rugosimonospora sp.]|nr:AAA family ATPase [Rugosimonospora sp.]
MGRAAELAAIADALDQLASGRGGLLWIEGGPGIGKSHLVAELSQQAARRDCAVRVGYADQLSQTFPLRVAVDALGITTWSADPVQATIARLLSGEAAGEFAYADPVLAASERMLDLLERVSAETPLALVLEDIQWADDASLVLAERLSRALDQIPVLLVLTGRPVPEEQESVRGALRERAVGRLTPGPLDQADVKALAHASLGGPPGPRLSTLLDTAAGSPLYVCEILRTLTRNDLSAHADGSVELGGTELLPGSLADAVGRRLSVLRPEHLQALRLAALLGDTVDPDDLELVLEQDGRPALGAATGAGIMEPVGGQVRFRHELMRQVLLAQTPRAVLGGLHEHIARALAKAGRPDSRVASHLTAAADPLPTWVLDWLVERPEPALYAAPDPYADLLRRAVESVGPDDGRRPALLRQLLPVLFWLGRDEAVAEFGAQAISSADDPDLAAALRIRVMRSLSRMRRFDEAVRLIEPALTDTGTSPVWRARATAWSATAQAFLGDPDRARSVGRQALDLATSIGDPLAVACAHSALAIVDGPDRVIDHLEAGLAILGDDPESLDMRLLIAGNRAARLGTLGSPQTDEAINDVLVTAERVGSYRTSTVHAHAVEHFYERGQWDETLMHIAQLDVAALRHPAFAYVLGIGAVISYRRGDPAEGARYLRAAGVPDPGPDGLPDTDGPQLIDAAALRAEWAGNHRQALRIRSRYLDLPSSAQRDSRSGEALYLIRLARALGDEETARTALDVVSAPAAPPTTD